MLIIKCWRNRKNAFKIFSASDAQIFVVKLSLCVNFINILPAAFSYKVVFAAFLGLQVEFVFVWCKNIDKKAALKMLVKLVLFS
jgi:hypothetical protein